MADEELRKAFAELQVKMIETNQRVRVSEGQITALKRSVAHAQLTDQELAALPDGTNTYQAVGRMFLLAPVEELREELGRRRVEAEDKIKSIQANIRYWEHSVKESEDGIREMVSQRRQ